MPVFRLHPHLAADTRELARWPLSRVLLMDDANYPWLILVPERDGAEQLHELPFEDQGQVMAEVTRAARVLEHLFAPDRINVAALGNLVPQLHVHVVARFTGDAAWPGPVWGAVPRRPYEAAALAERTAALCEALGGG